MKRVILLILIFVSIGCSKPLFSSQILDEALDQAINAEFNFEMVPYKNVNYTLREKTEELASFDVNVSIQLHVEEAWPNETRILCKFGSSCAPIAEHKGRPQLEWYEVESVATCNKLQDVWSCSLKYPLHMSSAELSKQYNIEEEDIVWLGEWVLRSSNNEREVPIELQQGYNVTHAGSENSGSWRVDKEDSFYMELGHGFATYTGIIEPSHNRITGTASNENGFNWTWSLERTASIDGLVKFSPVHQKVFWRAERAIQLT